MAETLKYWYTFQFPALKVGTALLLANAICGDVSPVSSGTVI